MSNKTASFGFRFFSGIMFLTLLVSALGVTTAHADGFIFYVKQSASGGEDCSSWQDACTLENAMTYASSGDEIWVAAGTYVPTTIPGDRSASFQLQSGVGVYGGFAGGEGDRTQRDPVANVTILSGDIDGNDSQNPIVDLTQVDGNAMNSIHVVRADFVDNTAVLDGFTITGGFAYGSDWPDYYGGGMYVRNGNPKLTNLVFTGNTAKFGGGLANDDSSNPSMYNITFSDNSAESYAGGMLNVSSSPSITHVIFRDNFSGHVAIDDYSSGGGMSNVSGSSPTLTDIIFTGNSATSGGGMENSGNSNPTLTHVKFDSNTAINWGYGGGMYNFKSSPTLTNVTFSSNISLLNGGGLFNAGIGLEGSYPVLTNVTFSGNTAENGGGMFNNSGSSPTLTNVTFSGNSAAGEYASGAGMFNAYYSNPVIRNTIFWGNTADYSGPQIFNDTSTPVVSDSVIEGDCPDSTTCSNVIPDDPMLGTLSNYGGYTDTIPLLPGSSAIDAGNNGLCMAETGTPDFGAGGIDQRGKTRAVGTSCDIGAFESGGFTIAITSGNNQSRVVNAPFSLLEVSVTSNSIPPEPVEGGAITFTPPGSGASASITGSPATISSGLASVSADANATFGAYTVTAHARGANNMNFSLRNLGVPTLSVTNSPVTYNAAPQAATLSSSVPGTISNIKYNGSSTVPTNVNTYTVTADFVPTDIVTYSNLNGAAATPNFVINQASQSSLTAIATPSTVIFGNTSALSISGGSGTGTVTFSKGVSTGCSIAGTTLSVTDASGNCSVTATKAADSNYLLATSSALTVTLSKADQATLTVIATPSTVAFGSTSTLSSSGGSGSGAVTYSAGSSTGCSIAGTTLSVTNASGTCDVTATKATDNDYNAATSAALPVTLNKIDQAALTAVAGPSLTYGNTMLLSASGGTGTGAVSFDAGISTGCTILSSTLSVSNASGTCIITAIKASDNNYNSASSAPISVTLTKADQTITFTTTAPSSAVVAGTTYVPAALGLSENAVVFTIDGEASSICSISSGNVSFQKVGTCVVDANLGSDTNYNAAPQVQQSFEVGKGTATVTFNAAPTPTYLGGDFTVSAATDNSDSSALTYSYVSGPCAFVSGATFSSTGAGGCVVQADGAATTNYNAASQTQTVSIGKAVPTLSVANSPRTYNGAAQAASVNGSVEGNVSNVQYDLSATLPTNAGIYAVTADFIPTDSTNFSSLTGAPAGNFVISKASSTLSVTNSPVTFNGAAQMATVTGSVAGTVSNVRYDLSSTVPTNAGAYAVTADFTPTDAANYSNLSGASAGTFVIDKAAPILSVTNSPVTFNGAAQTAAVNSSVAGTVSNVQYDLSDTAPTNAGTYAVTADFIPTDTTNYTSLTGAPAGSFTINKASPTLMVTNSPVTFNGASQAATVNGSVAGEVSNIRYNGSTTIPTNAATYAVTADFSPSNSTNYASLTGVAAGSFTINKADPTLSVTNSPVIFNGAAQAATVTGSVGGLVSNIKYGGSATVPTNAGTVAVSADFTPGDMTNYNSLTGSAAGNFTIAAATPTLSVANSPVTYNGLTQAATVNGSVEGEVSNVKYDGSATIPTNAGTYTVTASFTPADSTNYASLTDGPAGSFTINKASATLSVTNSPVTYDNTAQAASVASGAVVGEVSNIKYNGSVVLPTNAGTYVVTADFNPSDAINYASLSGATAGTFLINKANPTLSVTNSGVTFNGAAQTATVTGSVEGLVGNIQYDGSLTKPTDAGTYAITADFTPVDSTNYYSRIGAAAGNFVVNKADPSLSVTNSPVTFNGDPQAASVAGSVAGDISNVKYDGSTTAPTNAGTYAVTADFAPANGTNYNNLVGASAGNFVINSKLTPTLTTNSGPFTYDTGSHAATVTGSVPGIVSNVQYDGSTTEPTNAGTYAVTADFVPTDTAHYNSLNAAPAGSITINKANPTLSVTNSPVTFNGLERAASVAGSVEGVVKSVYYDGSETAPTNAGTYAVTADFMPTDDLNYNNLANASAGTFVIIKADPVLKVTNSPVIFNGAAQAAAVSAGPVEGEVLNVRYDGASTEPTLPGTYAVTADFGPTDTTNYNSLRNAPAGNFVINEKLNPALSTHSGPFTYDGASHSATVTGSVAGEVSNLQYDGSTTAPTNAGTYSVTADFAPADPILYNSLTGAPAGSITINKANPTLSLTNSPVTFNGSAQAAEVSGSIAGVVKGVLYDGSETAPTNAGTYTVTADFMPMDDANYNNLAGATAGPFIVMKANPTLAVTNPPITFDGTSKTATVTGSVEGAVSNIQYDGSVTVPTNAGTYAVTANFTPADTTNYNSLTGIAAGSLTINKADPTVSVTNSPVTFNGASQLATVTGSVLGSVSNVLYNASKTVPTNAGSYAVTASFMPTDSTNYNSLTDALAGSFTINKADPTLSVTNSPVLFNGKAQEAKVTAGSIDGDTSNVQYDGSTTSPTLPGSYAVTADFVPSDTANYTSLTSAPAGNFVISTATVVTLIKWDNPADIVYGTALSETQLNASAGGVPGTFVFTPDSGTVLAAGQHTLHVDFTPTDSALYTTASKDVSINVTKADASVSFVSSLNPSSFGQKVSYTATVSAEAGTPGGSVQFKVDGTTAGAPVEVINGTASIELSDMAPLSHTITATYSGDANFNGSTSEPITQTVNTADTTVSLAFAISNSSFALPVMLTATVKPAADGSETPTGSVIFHDGATVLGTVPLDKDGVAVLTTSTIARGSRSITVEYTPDVEGYNTNSMTQSVAVPYRVVMVLVRSENQRK